MERWRAFALVGTFALYAWTACNAILGNGYGREPSDGGALEDGTAPHDGPETRDGNAGDGSEDDAGNDGTTGAPCNLQSRFGAPTLAFFDTGFVIRDGWLTADELVVYYSTASQTGALHIARRPSADVPFNTADASKLGGPINEAGPTQYTPTLTPDEKTIYFGYDNRPNEPLVRVHAAVRSDITQDFGVPYNVTALDPTDATTTSSPRLNADASSLYFSLIVGNYHLAVAPVTSTGPGPVTKLVELNGSGERYPVPSADDLALYYMLATALPDGGIDNDIWVARRASTRDGFGDAAVVSELQSPYSEVPSWLSPDGCTLYFTSDRALEDGGGAGINRMWRAVRGK